MMLVAGLVWVAFALVIAKGFGLIAAERDRR